MVTGKTETFCFCFSPKQAAVISGIGTIVRPPERNKNDAWRCFLFQLFYLAALVYLFVKWAQLSEVALDIMALFQNLSIWLIVYTYFKMFMFVLIVPIVLQMLLGGFLLYGCWKASKRFMMPWMVMTPYTLCLAAFVSLYTTFTLNALHIFYFFFCGKRIRRKVRKKNCCLFSFQFSVSTCGSASLPTTSLRRKRLKPLKSKGEV